MPNVFAHTELSTTDVAAAKAFYAKIFDWQLQDVPSDGGGYTMIEVGGVGIGGIQAKRVAESPTAWLPYVEVADVRETIAKAQAAGAIILVEHQDIGAHGAIGVLLDPTGAAIGVWSRPLAAPGEKKPKKADADKQARKADKRARKEAKKLEAAKKAEQKAAEKQAKKARKAEEKLAEKARDAERALAEAAPAKAPRAGGKKSAKSAEKKAPKKAAAPKRKATATKKASKPAKRAAKR